MDRILLDETEAQRTNDVDAPLALIHGRPIVLSWHTEGEAHSYTIGTTLSAKRTRDDIFKRWCSEQS